MAAQHGIDIVDRPLSTGNDEVSLSAFGFLFSETVQYFLDRVEAVEDLEKHLNNMGKGIGKRMNELIAQRERPGRREIKRVQILQFIQTSVFKCLFGRQADALETTAKSDSFMIQDERPITNSFVSVPKQFGRLNCAAFIAGIIQGVLEGSGFPCSVTAHLVKELKTTYLIKFEEATK